jgi:hypothetical protein
MNNRDYIEDIHRLSVLHPKAKIAIMITSEEVTESTYSLQCIERVEYDLWYAVEENIYVGEDKIIEAIEEQIEENDTAPFMSDDDIEKQARIEYDALVESKKIDERIIIYTGAV